MHVSTKRLNRDELSALRLIYQRREILRDHVPKDIWKDLKALVGKGYPVTLFNNGRPGIGLIDKHPAQFEWEGVNLIPYRHYQEGDGSVIRVEKQFMRKTMSHDSTDKALSPLTTVGIPFLSETSIYPFVLSQSNIDPKYNLFLAGDKILYLTDSKFKEVIEMAGKERE